MANVVDERRRTGRPWTKWILIAASVVAVAYLVLFLVLQATGGSGSIY